MPIVINKLVPVLTTDNKYK